MADFAIGSTVSLQEVELQEAGFQDLVPWADPYIVQLVRKLQRASCGVVEPEWPDTDPWAEAPPPPMEPDTETPLTHRRGGEWPRRF